MSATIEVMPLLEDAVDVNGQAIIMPQEDGFIHTRDADIAPWAEPPSPRSKTRFHKPSFPSLPSLNLSHGSLSHRPSRGSESQSTLSIPDGSSSSMSIYENTPSDSTLHIPQLRKSKSSMFQSLIRPKRSKVGLRVDDQEHPSLRPVPMPDYAAFLPSSIPRRSPSPQPVSISPKQDSKRKRRKRDLLEPSEPPPTPPPKDDELRLDTNFEDLEGIVDTKVLHRNGSGSPTSPTSSHHFPSYSNHSPSHSSDHSIRSHITTAPDFRNPFKQVPSSSYPTRSTSLTASNHLSGSTVSPKTIPTHSISLPGNSIRPPEVSDDPNIPSWVAPESWAVQPESEEPNDEYSSGAEDTSVNLAPASVPRPSSSVASITSSNDSLRHNIDAKLPHSLNPHRNRNRMVRKPSFASTTAPSLSSEPPGNNWKIRIYLANHKYHIISVSFNVTVAALMPKLNQKILKGAERETHRLYLQERRRERVLGPTEKPAEIVKRRLLQAGYDPTDGIEEIAGLMGISFVLRFVYKSEVLGTAEKNIVLENYEYVDLSSRGLRAIPVELHKHAESIISLYLSRNPMLEIPLDFIQDCTTLRELRLSHMAMKKVPHSVRDSLSLHRLDLSCNRITDLDDAHLDYIPELQYLYVQNNRIDKLPWYFPRLRNLSTLNISNNQFVEFPLTVCELENLKDLDISFNYISQIPEEIAQLHDLERLIIVDNQVTKIPHECKKLVNLRQFDCRRNQVIDLTVICMLPRLEKLSADHNSVHALEVCLGPQLVSLDASHNAITIFSLRPNPDDPFAYALTSLDLSHSKLSVLDEKVLYYIPSLRCLNLDHNKFQSIPETLSELQWLESLSCADNSLTTLPNSIGLLQKLETLDAHNNHLTEIPDSLWQCASLLKINLTSNLLPVWHEPSSLRSTGSVGDISIMSERKASAASLTHSRGMPPLAYSLEKLYLGENLFTDEILSALVIFKELRVLNLSFNQIQELPNTFFKYFGKLEELYLSGNDLTALPTEDLPKLTKLSVLFLNGNKLQTLPQELGKVKSLMTLDVGSNQLRYNINNWEFDWNWNFNKNLKYLNMSGNKRLQIKSDTKLPPDPRQSRDMSWISRQSLAGFTDLTQLRVLGLMDVTITTTGVHASIDIPDENDDRRVRTSTVSGLGYGIADTLGKNEHLNMLDLVHEFPERPGEKVFAMFGRAHPPKALATGASSNRLAKFLHDGFIDVFSAELKGLKDGEDVPDAMRRTFLKLNHKLHDTLFSSTDRKLSAGSTTSLGSMQSDALLARSGASGIAVYIAGKKMYVANAGNALAVVSRKATAYLLSVKHDPYDREEMRRIRMAEGWISPPGLVNDEIDLSRSFGFFHLYSLIARPDVHTWDLTELDEFVIIANRGLWDYVSYQTAVDIARGERPDVMRAAQKLRDFAISYGAEGSTMIMVISVAELFTPQRPRQATLESAIDTLLPRRRRRDGVLDTGLARLEKEIAAPTGHITMVFTDIVNSTGLWEVNPGMRLGLAAHHNILRRKLRLCGGYEVKTEGDAFVVSFQSTVAALWWCLTIQLELLQGDWPLELLECDDGKPVYDSQARLIARGMSVRMGVHCGDPICEVDPITHRMDYYGPMVNRVARIEQSAAGGQIQVSSDVIKELQALKALDSDGEVDDVLDSHSYEALEAVRRIGMVIVPVGEVKLKGLETTLNLSTIYPSELEGRKELRAKPASSSGSRVQFSMEQMQQLGMLCLRLEALSTSRIFRKEEDKKHRDDVEEDPRFLYGNPNILLPAMNDNMSGTELMLLLDSMAGRIENAAKSIQLSPSKDPLSCRDGVKQSLGASLIEDGGIDVETLQMVLSVLRDI